MKNFVLTLAALASASCASLPSQAETGRMITFTSGAEGFHTNTIFFEGEKDVIAFDAQFTPALAKASIAYLRGFTAKPIRYLVITHPNPDKFNGAAIFQAEGAKVIASEATRAAMPGTHVYKENFFVNIAKMFQPGTYPKLPSIDESFRENSELVLAGGEKILLSELAEPGVSSTQTVAYIPSAQSLVVGDLVHSDTHAWLEGGIVKGAPTPTIAGWIADLRSLQSFPAETKVFGGRGSPALLPEAVNGQIAYLEAADSVVTEYVARVGKAELSGPNAGAHYGKIQAELEAKFPSRGLGYLIQYGVYGLVNSK
jgi:glyoxylase-like metal-dependent hydrolase (beta-lactamase superfamily II)